MKIDGFGIRHQDSCKGPNWRVSTRHTGPRNDQFCRSCGIRWKHGEPSGPARPWSGWTP